MSRTPQLYLDPSTKVWQPALGGGRIQETGEGFGRFVVTSGDVTERLEAVQHTLDAVAVHVSQDIACNRLMAIGPRQDHRQDALDEKTPHTLSGLVAEPDVDRVPFAIALAHVEPRVAARQASL